MTAIADRLLSTNELADLLGIKPQTVRMWVHLRKIAYVKVGAKTVRFEPSVVQEILERGRVAQY